MCDVAVRERLPGVTGLVDELVVATVNTRIYPITHERARSSIEEVKRRVTEMLGDRGDDEPVLTLGVAESCLVFEGRPLVGASLSAARIIETIESLKSSGIEFRHGITVDDVRALVRVLSARRGTIADHREANQMLVADGAGHLRFLSREEGVGFALASTGADLFDDSGTVRLPSHLYQGVVGCMQNMTVHICRGSSFELADANHLIVDILTELDTEPTAMLNLSRYEQYDAYTFGHSIRVCLLALNFAKQLTADREMRRRIGLAGLLHDIGKARVPFEILHSSSRFSDEERREMEKHVIHGGEILLELAEVEPLAVAVAFGHHRTLDGGGYPRTPSAPELSYVTRMVKICDVYEALTAVRPYKSSMSPACAYDIMLGMAGHFDGALLRSFIETNGLYPDGALVMLNTGETARVERQSGRLRAPVVATRTTPDGDLLDERDYQVIDLSRQHLGQGVWIEHGPVMTQSALLV